MMRLDQPLPAAIERIPVHGQPDHSSLFHRLNNQLGIILANAELLEARATDETMRARAAQVIASVIDAIATARDLRAGFEGDPGTAPRRE
jgi:hypothetical protein